MAVGLPADPAVRLAGGGCLRSIRWPPPPHVTHPYDHEDDARHRRTARRWRNGPLPWSGADHHRDRPTVAERGRLVPGGHDEETITLAAHRQAHRRELMPGRGTMLTADDLTAAEQQVVGAPARSQAVDLQVGDAAADDPRCAGDHRRTDVALGARGACAERGSAVGLPCVRSGPRGARSRSREGPRPRPPGTRSCSGWRGRSSAPATRRNRGRSR